MERLPDESVTIFILPPSYDVLRARLTSRGTEGRTELNTRLRNAFDEVQQYSGFDYVIVNEDVFTASRQISAIIMAERQCRDRQMVGIQVILDSFDAAKHTGR
jgi:guanylate kinase